MQNYAFTYNNNMNMFTDTFYFFYSESTSISNLPKSSTHLLS